MKTTLNFLAISIIAVSTLFLVGCEIDEIPDRDDTPPNFSFRITGDGFDRTFNQDTDFNNLELNLRTDQLFAITLSGADAGGIQIIQWFTGGSSYFRQESVIPSPWVYRTGLQSVVQWQGSRDRPLTGAIFDGTFKSSGGNIAADFKFYVADFGGRSGAPNVVSKKLEIYLSDAPTALRGR